MSDAVQSTKASAWRNLMTAAVHAAIAADRFHRDPESRVDPRECRMELGGHTWLITVWERSKTLRTPSPGGIRSVWVEVSLVGGYLVAKGLLEREGGLRIVSGMDLRTNRTRAATVSALSRLFVPPLELEVAPC